MTEQEKKHYEDVIPESIRKDFEKNYFIKKRKEDEEKSWFNLPENEYLTED